jgi:hypothetical protein
MPTEYTDFASEFVQCRCSECGALFEIALSRVEAGRGRTCSRVCGDQRRSRAGRLALSCKACKQVVWRPRSKALTDFYCSLKCALEDRRRRVYRNCRACGGLFTTIPARLREGRGIYCSQPCYTTGRRHSLEERFWSYVDKTSSLFGCWLWTGEPDQDGYGILGIDRGHNIRAHRLSWKINRGPIPTGLLICHNCPERDNRACVNPDHLWTGTHAQNIRDRDVKAGRY